ncbi:Acid sphingomyelinase-like phosphodiesterase [Legionella birminghamensis]|uniref:Acid sphingomyelinase-like phosphodiesterase n=2 Tax=Legionella birminghamensis TaxID=28083 RepID=A0A378I6I4_9GAMM|nr:Acid sphingomyelinase-like phosphodiesterase [Legionella birminghamensis]STX30370.1 Acid sphingomyelinase-like phosphodiesterase [Legionella birminghamensis]
MNTKKLMMVMAASLLYAVNPSAIAAAAASNQAELFLISDPHLDVTLRKTTNINPPADLRNELDQRSYQTLISKMGEQVDLRLTAKPSVVILGDLPAHNGYSRKTSRDDINAVFEPLYERLNPASIFYVFGNNDSLQRNYGPFSYRDESAYTLMQAVTGNGGGFLSTGRKCPYNGEACVSIENTKYGFYSAYLGDHLKLVSLNSVSFVSRPGFSPSRDGAKEQMKWLESQLKSSRAKHNSVVLAMHVPPQSWEPEYQDSFKKIIKAYPEVVIGMMAAHSHFDEIRAMTIGNKSYVIPIVYSAGLGVDHGNASSFKTLSFSRQSASSPWRLKDYVTYHFIGKTASSSQLLPYYDFNQAFCGKSSGETVSECLKKHINNNKFDSSTSTLMSKHYTAGNPNNNKRIDPSSKWIMVVK